MGRRLGAQFYAPSTWVTKQNNRTIVLLFLGEKRRFSLTSFRWVFSSIFIAREGVFSRLQLFMFFRTSVRWQNFLFCQRGFCRLLPHAMRYSSFQSLFVDADRVTRIWSCILLPAAAPLREYVTLSVFFDVVA